MGNQAIGGGGFHHIALKASDYDRSVAFYTETMGFRPVRAWGAAGERGSMLDTGDGSLLEVFEGGPAEATDTRVVHFALKSSDCDAAIERVRKAGMTVTVEPKNVDIPSTPPYPVRIGFFKGPDGEIIEFFQER